MTALVLALLTAAGVGGWAGWRAQRSDSGAGRAFLVGLREATAVVSAVVAALLALVGVPLLLLATAILLVGGAVVLVSSVLGDASMLGLGQFGRLALSGLAATAVAAALAGVSALCGGRRMLTAQQRAFTERAARRDQR